MRRSRTWLVVASVCALPLLAGGCASTSTSNSVVGEANLTSTGMRAAPAGPLSTANTRVALTGDLCGQTIPCIRGIDFDHTNLVVAGNDKSVVRDVRAVSAKLVDAKGVVLDEGEAEVHGDKTSVGITRWDAWWTSRVPTDSLKPGSRIKFKWQYQDCQETCDVVTTVLVGPTR